MAITVGSASLSILRLDDGAALLRHVAPPRARELEHLVKRRFTSTGTSASGAWRCAIELTHARHRVRDIVDGALDDLELLARAFAEAGFVRQQRIDIQR